MRKFKSALRLFFWRRSVRKNHDRHIGWGIWNWRHL